LFLLSSISICKLIIYFLYVVAAVFF
jgi:hypothetical protein